MTQEQIDFEAWIGTLTVQPTLNKMPGSDIIYSNHVTRTAFAAWQAGHARYAIPECHSIIGDKRTEDMDNKELRYHLQESSRIMQQQADEIEALKAKYAGGGGLVGRR